MSVRKTALILALAAMGGWTAAQAESIFVGGELGWIDRPSQTSSVNADQVRAEAIRSHRDGTMLHAEYAPKSKPFQSTRSRAEVRAEAIQSHRDGTMLHSEITPLMPHER
ncbi:MAG: hypothetical protein NDJ19_00085 [Ramlibacter sp.]|nr:hypothetical protein [Ramlibacter sp.]